MSNVSIVTGASSGLGLELAVLLATTSQKVLGVSRHYPTDARWLDLERRGVAKHVAADVGTENAARLIFDAAATLGTPKTLVNAAGQGIFGPAGSYTKRDFDDVCRGNLTGLVLMCEKAIEVFRIGGTIINVMSTAAQIGRAGEAIYCAAKWGARGYTEAIRTELKGSPIRVVAVYPGGMKTAFWTAARGTKADPSKFMDPCEVAKLIQAVIDSPPGTFVSDIIINRG